MMVWRNLGIGPHYVALSIVRDGLEQNVRHALAHEDLSDITVGGHIR